MKTTSCLGRWIRRFVHAAIGVSAGCMTAVALAAPNYLYSYNLIFQNETGVPATDFHMRVSWPTSITITLPNLPDVYEFDPQDNIIGRVFSAGDAVSFFSGGANSTNPTLSVDFFASTTQPVTNPVVNPNNQIQIVFGFISNSNQGVLSELYWTNSALITPTNPEGKIPGSVPKDLNPIGGVSIRLVSEPGTLSLVGLLLLQGLGVHTWRRRSRPALGNAANI